MNKKILTQNTAVSGNLLKWIFLGMICYFLSGCSKDNNSKSAYTLDQEIFFTLETGNATYKTNGYYRMETPDINGGPTLYVHETQDSTGNPVTEITIRIQNVVQDGIVSGTSLPSFLSLGNCEGEINMQKSGNEITGTFNQFKGQSRFYTNYFNTQENQVSKSFTTDSVGLNYQIVKETKHTNGKPVLEGYFSCNLFEGNNSNILIPAHGTFRLYKVL